METLIETAKSINKDHIDKAAISLTFCEEDIKFLLLFYIYERTKTRTVEDNRLRHSIDNNLNYNININKKTVQSLQQNISDTDGLALFKLMSFIIHYYTSESTEVNYNNDQEYANLNHVKKMIYKCKEFVESLPDYSSDEDKLEFSAELGEHNFFNSLLLYYFEYSYN